MLEKGTYISNEVLNEGIIDDIGYKLGLKKKSRWQRFKDTIKSNKGKAAAAGILGLGAAGALGYSRYNYGKLTDEFHKKMKGGPMFERQKDRYFYKDPEDGKLRSIRIASWNPFKRGLYRSPKDLRYEIADYKAVEK